MKKFKFRKTATIDGKRYNFYGDTEKECIEKMAEKKAALKRGEGGINGNMTCKAWSKTWLDTYVKPRVREPGAPKQAGTMSEKSYSMYVMIVDDYITPAVGKYKMKDIKDTHLQKMLNEEAGRSKSLVTKIRITTQAMFRQALVSRIIFYDPSVALKMPVTTERERRSLTAEEKKRLEATGDTMALFWLNTGLRPGEMKALQKHDFDLKKNLIHICRSVESGTSVIGEPKTSAGYRYLPITEKLKAVLPDLNGDPFDFVFGGSSMMTDWLIRSWWEGIREQAKLPDDLTPYDLRHTYCTDLQAAGVDIKTASYLMGHSDISVTANIYTHAGEQTAIAALTVLNSVDVLPSVLPNNQKSADLLEMQA